LIFNKNSCSSLPSLETQEDFRTQHTIVNGECGFRSSVGLKIYLENTSSKPTKLYILFVLFVEFCFLMGIQRAGATFSTFFNIPKNKKIQFLFYF